MMPHQDRVYAITGSSRGIGRATAEWLAREGARVVVSSRSVESCQPAVQAIREAGGEAHAIACHVGREEQLEALVEGTIQHYGRLDGLVCNAASNPVYGPSATVEYAAFETIMRNNVYSAQRLAALAAPHLGQGGSLVLVSSVAGLIGNRVIGTYGVSKAAEMQVVRNLALELGGQGVRVNGVAPGLIETDFARALTENPKMVARIEQRTALGRLGQPDDIAGVIAFLLSPASAYVTGQTIVADGGVVIADIF